MGSLVVAVLAALALSTTAQADFRSPRSPSELPGHFNVRNYGANGQDGVLWSTNDTAAFQAAVDAAGAAGGGVVDIPPGVYYLQDSLVVNYDGVTLKGSGRADIGGDWDGGTILYTVRFPSGEGNTGILFGHKSDSTVTFSSGMEDLTVRCDQGRIGHCIWAQNVQGFFLRNVDVYANSLAPPDAKYAGVYIQSANDGANADWKLQTTKNRITDSNIYCPKGFGASGAGYGLLIASTTDNAVNTACIVQGTTIANAQSPGRSIMVTAKCFDCGDLTNSQCNGHQFINVRVDGNSGVEFCQSHRNMYLGQIDMNTTTGDTAVFNHHQSQDNMIIGRVDGYVFDEQPLVYRKVQVIDPSYRNGMQVRAMGFQDMGGDRADLGGGEQEPPASIFYDSTVGRLILKTSAGEDTLVVRGE